MKIFEFVSLIIILITLSKCSILKLNFRTNNPQVLGRIMISYTTNQNHAVAISKANISQLFGNQFHFIFINYASKNYTVQTLTLPFNAIYVRSNHDNYNDPNISNRRFLILDSTQTTIVVYNSTALLKNITVNNTIVVDYCFETNRDEFYTLQTTNVSGSPYRLGYYSLLHNWSRRINITENFNPAQKITMKCLRSSIFLNFTAKVRVYSLNQSMWNIKTIRDHGNLYNMNTFGQILTVRNDTHILMFNASANYSLAKTILTDPLYTYFESIYFGSNTYLYIARQLI